MIDVRPFATLGSADHGWLDAHHHFSFANYFDPARMGWGALRVWNDDRIAPRSGFPPHPHRDMEIITYVRQGTITHEDSMGNRGRTPAGDVQVMSAGTGIRHSEYNLDDEDARIFQIWIEPRERGGVPSWGAKPFPKADRAGRFVVLASGFADEGALPIAADARVAGATVTAGNRVDWTFAPGARGYLVPATGRVRILGEVVNARDGVAIRDLETVRIEAEADSELVLVETV